MYASDRNAFKKYKTVVVPQHNAKATYFFHKERILKVVTRHKYIPKLTEKV